MRTVIGPNNGRGPASKGLGLRLGVLSAECWFRGMLSIILTADPGRFVWVPLGW